MRLLGVAVAAGLSLALVAGTSPAGAAPSRAPAEVTDTIPAGLSQTGAVGETLAQANDAAPLGARKPAGKRWSLGKASFFLVYADGEQVRVEDKAIAGEIDPTGPCMTFDDRGGFVFTTRTPGGLAWTAGGSEGDGLAQVVGSVYNRSILTPGGCDLTTDVVGVDTAQLSLSIRPKGITVEGSEGAKLCQDGRGCNANWFYPIHAERGIPLTAAIKRKLDNRNVPKVTLQFDLAETASLQGTDPQTPCYDTDGSYSRCTYTAVRSITITLVRTDMKTYMKAMNAHLKTLGAG